MIISSADGQDENWNRSVVKTLLNSEDIKYINFVSIEEYRQLYKTDTEVFGYSEDKALQVVSECLAAQNVSMLADSAVKADEYGNVLLDENGHAQLIFSYFDSSNEGVIRPFFRNEPDDALNSILNDYFDSSEVSIDDINDMMTISDSGLFSNLLESSDKLNEELARFVVEYPECVSSNTPILQKVLENVNQNESTRALVEKSVELTNPIAAGAIVVGAIVVGFIAGKLAEMTHDRIVEKLFGASHARVPVDPLIIDINADGFNIEKRSHGSYFDLNCDGFAEKINWTTRDGILALDLDNNGRIDDGREVFGDYHEIADGIRAKNGFEALAHYDSNEDGVIDGSDEVFNSLKVWVDSNGNGISESNELKSLRELGINKINLNYEEANRSTGTEAPIDDIP